MGRRPGDRGREKAHNGRRQWPTGDETGGGDGADPEARDRGRRRGEKKNRPASGGGKGRGREGREY
jgi:hypothetical protein